MPVISAQDTGGANVLAFLNILAFSEGTSTIKASEDGYNVMVGGKLFNDYRSPPRILVDIPRYGIGPIAQSDCDLPVR